MPRYKKINQLPMWAMATATVAAAFLIVGCGNGPGQQAGRSHVPEVAVVTVEPRPIELTTELPGRTSAYLVSEIRPQVNGIIQKRMFKEGSDVNAGDLLYQIDPAPFQLCKSLSRQGAGQSALNPIKGRTIQRSAG